MPSEVEWACRFAAEVCRDPEKAISRWKALSGRRSTGCVPTRIPEEIPHAAGMLPVTVWGDEFGPHPPEGDPPFGCFPASDVVAAIRSGRWGEVDAWAYPADCDACRGAFDSLLPPEDGRPRFPFSFPLPADAPGAAEDMLDRVEDFREWAGRISGREVSEGALEKSVRAYNRNRSVFARLEETMRKSPGSFSGAEFLSFVRSGMVLPKEAHTEILVAALSRLRTVSRPVRAKVFLTGWTVTFPVVEAIDAAEAVIVGDDLAIGHRYYSGSVDEEGDMPLVLARRILRGNACLSPHGQGPTPPELLFRRYSDSGADRMMELRMRPRQRGAGGTFDLETESWNRGIAFLRLDVDCAAAHGPFAKERIASFLEKIS